MKLPPDQAGENDPVYSSGALSLATHFSAFITRLAEKPCPELSLAAALVSRKTSTGHTCVDLSAIAGNTIPAPGDPFHTPSPAATYPEVSHWRSLLLASKVVGRPGEIAPLILDIKDRLYLQRYWHYENTVAGWFRDRNQKKTPAVALPLLDKGLSRLFPETALPPGETDWQKIAALAAIRNPFTVLSGGPGTGKTTTVARILALVCELSHTMPTILLAAPTGKAATRLQDSINAARPGLDTSPEIKAAIPERAATIHRLLKVRGGRFLHNAENPLPADLIVVDEASMIDLPLMAALLLALPEPARLILAGDHNQLASVEPGSVLGDICSPRALSGFSAEFRQLSRQFPGGLPPESPAREIVVSDGLVELKKNFRFAEDSGIRRAGDAIHNGEAETLLEILENDTYTDITWHQLPDQDHLEKLLRRRLTEERLGFLTTSSPDEAFAALSEFRILCALRHGPFGVIAINAQVEDILAATGRIARPSPPTREIPGLYNGRPVMITTNDYRANLFNGDTGILLPDPAGENQLRAFFQESGRTTRSLSPHRLPPHETAHAMTIHKSQGSEFARILLILPPTLSPVLTRELLYTALTRARTAVEVWADETILRETVSARSHRDSGLGDALWGEERPGARS